MSSTTTEHATSSTTTGHSTQVTQARQLTTRRPMTHLGKPIDRWIGTGVDTVWIGPVPPFKRHGMTSALRTAAATVNAVNTPRMIQPQLPSYWQITSHTQSGPATGTTVRKSKSKSKTVNQKPTVHSQRSEWAHAHFIIHHGTNADTAQFLTHPRNVKNTPVDALKEIRVMSVERVPT